MTTQPLEAEAPPAEEQDEAAAGSSNEISAEDPSQEPIDSLRDRQNQNRGETSKSYLRVKVDDKVFTSLDGVLKLAGCRIVLSTDSYSHAWLEFSDPDGAIAEQIGKESKIEIEIGFVDGPSENKFVGQVFWEGRRLPSSTLVYAVDNSAQLGAQAGPSASFSDDLPKEAADRAKPSTTLQDLVDEGIAADKPQPPPGAKQNPSLAELLEKGAASSEAAADSSEKSTLAELMTLRSSTDLQFVKDSATKTAAHGEVRSQQNNMAAAVAAAAEQGDVLVTRGNTVHQVAPGGGEDSGLALNYISDRPCFIGHPKILKKGTLQLMGAYTVMGYSGADKRAVGATVTVPGSAPIHPTGVVQAPEWGSIVLSEPINPGSLYTWNDATRNGTRVPDNREVIDGIMRIDQIINQLCQKYNGGQRMQINSWFRDRASNEAAGSSEGSRHRSGDAIDFYNSNMDQIHTDLAATWEGGVAISRNSFVHIDDRGHRSRWTYG